MSTILEQIQLISSIIDCKDVKGLYIIKMNFNSIKDRVLY